MSKKFYHIPLQKMRLFLKNNKSELNATLKNYDASMYAKNFGRAYYELEIEEFILFFKIDANLGYALKTINYFHSEVFLKILYEQLNFEQFEGTNISDKEIFYIIVYLYKKYKPKEFHTFIHSFMLHFFSSSQDSSKLYVNHKDMLNTLVTQNKGVLKETFGESEGKSYFKLTLNESFTMQLEGKSIKTLRKKLYKKFFLYVLDNMEVLIENLPKKQLLGKASEL